MKINFDASPIKGLNVVVLSSDYDEKVRRALVQHMLANKVHAWSMDELTPGMDWNFETLKHISEAHFIFVLFSQNGMRDRGFFQTTIRKAKDCAQSMLDGDIFIIPIILEENVDVSRMGLPEPLRIREDKDWEVLGRVLKLGVEQRF